MTHLFWRWSDQSWSSDLSLSSQSLRPSLYTTQMHWNVFWPWQVSSGNTNTFLTAFSMVSASNCLSSHPCKHLLTILLLKSFNLNLLRLSCMRFTKVIILVPPPMKTLKHSLAPFNPLLFLLYLNPPNPVNSVFYKIIHSHTFFPLNFLTHQLIHQLILMTSPVPGVPSPLYLFCFGISLPGLNLLPGMLLKLILQSLGPPCNGPLLLLALEITVLLLTLPYVLVSLPP